MTRQSATASPQPDPDRPGRSRRWITTRTHPQADSASPLASWHSTAGLDDRPAARPALNRPDLYPLIFQDRAGHSMAKPANVDLTAAHLDPGGASRRTGHLIGVPGAQRQRGAFTPDGIIAASPGHHHPLDLRPGRHLAQIVAGESRHDPVSDYTREAAEARRAFRRAQTGAGL